MKRLLSFLLALALCVGMLPAGVWAETAEPTQTTAPAETTQPEETTQPTEAEPEETTEPTAATEPTEATEPEGVTEPEESADDALPEDTEDAGALIEKPAETGKVTYLDSRTEVYIHPDLRGEITEEDVLREMALRPALQALEQVPVYYSMEDFNAALIAAVRDHQDNFSMELWSEEEVDFDNLVFRQTVHGKDPVMGDYQGGQIEQGYTHYDVTLQEKLLPDGTTKTYYVYTYYNEYVHRTTREQELQVDAKVAEILRELQPEGKSDVEKICAIYNYMISHIRYDYENLNDKSYNLKYTAYAALVNNTAVCMGYSLAFYRLALECGVDARYVDSFNMNHAWNIVTPDGGQNYYYVDATWDERITDEIPDNCGSYFLRGKDNWLCYHKDPNGVSELGDYISDYPIPDGDYADWTLTEDGTLTVPSAVIFLQRPAWPQSPFAPMAGAVRHIRLTAPLRQLPYHTFCGDVRFPNLESIELSDSIEEMGDTFTFSGCTALKRIVLPAGLKSIPESAFLGLTDLESVTFPAALEEIGKDAFSRCESLKTVNFPDSLKRIGENAFYGAGLRTLTLGPNVERVEAGAFSSALEELTIQTTKATFAESAIHCNYDPSVPEVKKITVPAALPLYSGTISCTSVKTLVLTGPGEMADYTKERLPFWSISNIDEIVVDDTVTALGRYGLAACFAKEVRLPEGIAEIPEGLFWGTQLLKTVRLPASVTHVANAFGGYHDEILFTGTKLPKLDADAFAGAVYGVTCRFPCNWTQTPSGNYGAGASYGEVRWEGAHDLIHFEAQAPTEEAPGRKEHWKCATCGRFFLKEREDWEEEDRWVEVTEDKLVIPIPGRYTLSYRNAEGAENPNPALWTADEALNLAQARKPGFRFLCWTTDPAGKNPIWAIPTGNTADVILYAQWQANTYTVHFNANGGTGSMKDQTLTYDKAAALTANAFKRTGYRFDGWQDGGGSTYADRQTVTGLIPEGTIELTARWEPIAYTVKFKANGGEGTMEDAVLTYDVPADLPPLGFVRPNYRFEGWAASASGKVICGPDARPGNLTAKDGAVVTLYAKWVPFSYTVVYDGNGATKGTMKDQTMLCGKSYTLAKNAYTRTGYSFLGWSTAPDAVAPEFANGQKNVSLSGTDRDVVTLYAVWSAISYKLTYKNLTAAELGEMPQSYTVEDTVTLPDMARAGYDFGGWFLDAGFKKPVSTLSGTGARTLYAKWTAHKYTVLFDGSGAEKGAVKPLSMTCGTAKALPKNAFVKTGYTFLGWAKEPGADPTFGNQAKVQDLTTEDGGTVTLYAAWTPTVYKLTYKNLTAEELQTLGGSYTVEDAVSFPEMTRAGYDFGGWFLDAGFKKPAPVSTDGWTGTKTVYAKWTAHRYTVRFEGSGAEKGAMKDLAMTYGAAKALTRNAYTRAGYTFLGWSPDPLAAAPAYKNQEKVRNLTADEGGAVTLYAVWTPIAYKLTYKNLTADELREMPQSYTVEDTVTLPDMTREGYDFGGWFLDAGFKKPVSVLSGTGAKTLYAKWTAHRYTLRFDGNGAAKGTMKDLAMTYGVGKGLPGNAFARTGYTFLGWSTDPLAAAPEYKNQAKVMNLTAADGAAVTLYAVWKAK